jgi:succinate dehydrogenase/fumarate reductase flavoprotein subunit
MEHHSLAPATNTGDGIEAALRVGARLDAGVLNAGAWTPVSRVPQRDGGTVPLPHYVDRAKPGIIAVDSHARVLGADGMPIAGLYAAGNDVVSPTGGEYPAAGVTVGAAMTFGFLAGSHAATRLHDER